MASRRDAGARRLLFALVLLIALVLIVDLFRSNSFTRGIFAAEGSSRTVPIDLIREVRPR